MDLDEGEHEGGLMAKCKNCGAEKSRDSRKERCYKCEAKKSSTKEKKDRRAETRRERVKRGLTAKNGMANGNGDKHIAHNKYKGKGGVRVKTARANQTDQPKRS